MDEKALWPMLMIWLSESCKNVKLPRFVRRLEDIEVILFLSRFNKLRRAVSANRLSGRKPKLFLERYIFFTAVNPRKESAMTCVKLLFFKDSSSSFVSPRKAFPAMLVRGLFEMLITERLGNPWKAFCGIFETPVFCKNNTVVAGGIEPVGMLVMLFRSKQST